MPLARRSQGAGLRELWAAGSTDPDGGLEWFAISYDDMGPVSAWADTLLGGDPAGGRIEVTPASSGSGWPSSRSTCRARRFAAPPGPRTGPGDVHSKGGGWLANGSAHGLVKIEIDPHCHTERCLSTLFLCMKVNEPIVCLVDPDGFIAAVQRDGVQPHTGSPKE